MTIQEIEQLGKNFLNSEETASALGISRKTFYRDIIYYKGKFPIEQRGRNYRIPKYPFLAYLRNGDSSRG